MLKITDGDKWHILALPSISYEDGVKKLTKTLYRLMEGISSKSHGGFYCYGCLHSSCTLSTLKNHVELCKYNKACKIKLPKKINKQVPCGYSINVITNHNNQSKQNYYRGNSTVSTFCKEIRDIAQNLLNIEKNPMQNLSNEEQITRDNAEYYRICKKVFGTKKNQVKVRDHDHYTGKYRGPAHLICNLRYSTHIGIPVFFHNGTNYDFNLIITELAKGFRSEMRCIRLNTNKYISFSIPIKKEIKEQSEQQEINEQQKINKESKQKNGYYI